MYCYSYDVIFTAGADTILSKFRDFEARVVFSAEGFCWPDQSLAVRRYVHNMCLFTCVYIAKYNIHVDLLHFNLLCIIMLEYVCTTLPLLAQKYRTFTPPHPTPKTHTLVKVSSCWSRQKISKLWRYATTSITSTIINIVILYVHVAGLIKVG